MDWVIGEHVIELYAYVAMSSNRRVHHMYADWGIFQYTGWQIETVEGFNREGS